MSDPILAYLDARRLGRVDERLALSGWVPLTPKLRARAELVQTTAGIYLVAAHSSSQGLLIDLNANPDLRYEIGRLSDRIRFGSVSLSIPAGKGSTARETIALGRLGVRDVENLRSVLTTRYVEEPTRVERAFLQRELGKDEALLVWLKTQRELPVESPVLNEASGTARFMLTSDRAELVTLSALGDIRLDAVDARKFRVEGRIGRREIVSAAHRFHSTLGNADRWDEIAPLLTLSAVERELEMARLCWVSGADPSSRARARALILRAARGGHAAAATLALMLRTGDTLVSRDAEAARETPLPDPQELAKQGVDPELPADLWARWQLSPEAGLALMTQLRDGGGEPWSVRLHRRVHARLTELREDPARLAEADLSLAEHLIAVSEKDAARALLQRRISKLPSEALEDLLPPSDADLTAGAGGQVLRVRTLELLAKARAEGEVDDETTLVELARLQPLLLSRLERLAGHPNGGLRQRAQTLLALLAPRGLARAEPASFPSLDPLSEERIRLLLRHPVEREGSDFVGKLQALLASVPVPDHRALRSYVERLSEQHHAPAARALAAAGRMLNVKGIEGYISRGQKSIGIRSYEGSPPFVLVGGRHLDENDPAWLNEAELRFAIGAELAHLLYGHTRVTSSEVWAGAWEKSTQGLDFALGVLPLLKGFRMVERATRMVDRIPTTALKRLFGSAKNLSKGLAKQEPTVSTPSGEVESISALNEQLVATHRVMQLTADRAGFLLAQSPNAAVRAMLLVRPDYLELLDRSISEGIEAVLAERDDAGLIVHQDLAVRVAALLAFYLSEDWLMLTAAGSNGEAQRRD